MSKQQGMACSSSTVLRLLRHDPLPTPLPVKVLGVDEWAWRKGQSYGTILVDLERHILIDILIDLLQDASADSFAAWLQEHPSVELISRDRGTTFADGANRGAPQALQIADRWHVIHNLGEALEKVLARHHADLKAALTYEWSQGQVEGQVNRLKLIKRQVYGRAEFDLLPHRVLARSA
jgi:transposase